MNKLRNIEEAKEFFRNDKNNRVVCVNNYKEITCYTFSQACEFFNTKNHYWLIFLNNLNKMNIDNLELTNKRLLIDNFSTGSKNYGK